MNISIYLIRERKKNTKKANQMCELRLALERQKMERWEKLQVRTVQYTSSSIVAVFTTV